MVWIVQIKHVSTEWFEKCRHPGLLLPGVQFVFGKPSIPKSREGIVVARDEPRGLAIGEFHREHRFFGPKPRVKRIGIRLELRF